MDEPWARDLAESQALFDAGKFFEAHERLEDAWRRETGERKLCAQGLTQICAAFHKLGSKEGSISGALELLQKGGQKITLPGMEGLRARIDEAIRDLKAGRRPTATGLRWS